MPAPNAVVIALELPPPAGSMHGGFRAQGTLHRRGEGHAGHPSKGPRTYSTAAPEGALTQEEEGDQPCSASSPHYTPEG